MLHKIEFKNGYTKESTIAKLKAEFKGKANNGSGCFYLTDDGRKCAIGCFLAKGPWQKDQTTVSVLIETYPQVAKMLPMDLTSCYRLQEIHDKHSGNTEAILDDMISYIEDYT